MQSFFFPQKRDTQCRFEYTLHFNVQALAAGKIHKDLVVCFDETGKNNLLVIIGFFFLNGDTIKDWKIMHCSKTVLSSNPVHAIGCSSCWMVDRFYSRHWGRGDGAVTATLTSAQCRIGHPCRQAAVPLHKYTFTHISCSDCIFNGSLEVFVFLRGTRLYCTFYPA